MHVSDFFKNTKPFGQLVALGLLFFLCMVVSLPVLAGGNTALDTDVAIRRYLVCQGGTQLITFMLSALLFALFFHGHPLQFFQAKLRGRYWLLALAGVAVSLLAAPAIDWLSAWNEGWDLGRYGGLLGKTSQELSETTEKMLSLTSAGDFLLQVLVVALIPALCEELFFRGALQPTMQCLVRNGHVGIVLTAAIFSLVHGDIYGFFPRFMLGLLIGYLYWFSGSMVVNVCVHFVNNLIVVVAYRLYHLGTLSISPADHLLLPWWLTAVGLLGAILLFYMCFIKNRQKEAR